MFNKLVCKCKLSTSNLDEEHQLANTLSDRHHVALLAASGCPWKPCRALELFASHPEWS